MNDLNARIQGESGQDNGNVPKYRCISETIKPQTVLVHEPGLEVLLAVEHPYDWGFDPSLTEYPHSSRKWLEDAVKEHEMVRVLRRESIEVLHLKDLLERNIPDVVKYLENQFERVWQRIGKFDSNVQSAVREAYEQIVESPVEGLLLGLEFGRSFRRLPYETKLEVYRDLKTMMPQTSIYFMQDPVITSPAGLIKSRMSMWIRRQEPDIVEIALGKENYVHRLRNTTEGGDVTMCSYPHEEAFAHGGDVSYVGGRMLFGISALSGENIDGEIETLAERAGVTSLIKLYVPDYFDRRKRYATENVMHNDTIQMPVSNWELLANKMMLEQSAVREGRLPVNAYDWAFSRNNGKRNFERLIEVPNDEQLLWGANVFPMGDRKILSARHLPKTNRNLREAGFEVFDFEAKTVTSGYGSWHCMIAYLR